MERNLERKDIGKTKSDFKIAWNGGNAVFDSVGQIEVLLHSYFKVL